MPLWLETAAIALAGVAGVWLGAILGRHSCGAPTASCLEHSPAEAGDAYATLPDGIGGAR